MTKFFYLRQPNANTRRQDDADKAGILPSWADYHRGDPIACVAYEKHPTTNIVKFAVSTLNTKHDEFVKAEARKLAYERLHIPAFTEYDVIAVNSKQTRNADFVYEIVKFLADSTDYPSRVKKAAKRHLTRR